MRICRLAFSTSLSVALLALGGAPRAQPSPGTAHAVQATDEALAETGGQRTWHVIGKVTDLRGQPLKGTKVQVRTILGEKLERALRTNLQGEFQTQITTKVNVPTLRLQVIARKSGYRAAEESIEISLTGTDEIILVMRPEKEDLNQLSQQALVSQMKARLAARVPEVQGRVIEEFLDRWRVHGPSAVENSELTLPFPQYCAECRMWMAMVLLEKGSFVAANRQVIAATEINDAAKASDRMSEPLIVSGTFAAWSGKHANAAKLFREALTITPNDALALQELGRALVHQQNWEVADECLAQAIQAGASEEARLLRVKVLLAEGEVELAKAELDRYVNGSPIKDLPPPATELRAQVDTRMQLISHRNATTTVTQPIAEMIQSMPELKGLEPAPNQDQLPNILKKTGASVDTLFRYLPNTAARENIQQEKLNKKGKRVASQEQNYLYLLLVKPGNREIGIEEYRGTADGTPASPKGLTEGYMLTQGFASASLVLHPINQPGTSYRYLGRQRLNEKDTYVVAFAQKPETARTIERFTMGNVSVFILSQGLAWIDAANYQVLQLRTDMLNTQPRVRLHRQTTEISYGEVQFKELPIKLWLPRKVSVTVDFRNQSFRNLHAYSDFKLFNVQATEKAKSPPELLQTPPEAN